MSLHSIALFGDQIAASRVAAKFSGIDARALLRLAIEDLYKGRIALVSSFGADSAVLLHMVSTIDKAIPVIFVDTKQLFPETLDYRDGLIQHLGLTSVRTHAPDKAMLAAEDPENFLWASDPDRCCDIRKVAPLGGPLDEFEAWITGRKQFQSNTRAALPFFEAEGERVKVNPLAGWSATKVLEYIEQHQLPKHSLVAKNYLSIGCMPCTSPVRPGEDARAGRWRGRGKVECGIHIGALNAGSDI